jgi:flagellar hook-basal body complex protein FliE
MNNLKIQEMFSVPSWEGGKEKVQRQDILQDFQKILSDSIGEVDRLTKEADQSMQEMALGKVDIHEAMIAMEKANIAFRLMVQVRNKVIGAYEEIMRMQV